MRKLILVTTILFTLSACNHHSEQPDAPQNSTGNDSMANATLLKQMNSLPQAGPTYVKVNTTQAEIIELKSRQIDSYLATLKASGQKFTVNPAEPISVKASGGTRVIFEAGSFVSKSGTPVSEPIELQIKECYSVSEMLAEGLTTTSDKNILESKGMVYVNATTLTGEVVQLKEGQNYDVVFPFNTKEKGFGFYYGQFDQKGIINWQHDKAEQQEQIISPPTFEFAGADFQQYLFSHLMFPDEARRNEISSDVEAEFTIDEEGKVNNVGVTGSYKMFKDAVTDAFDKMPAWTPSQVNGKPVSVTARVKVTFNTRSRYQVNVDYNPNNFTVMAGQKEKNKNMRQDINNCISAKTCSLKSFTKTGWINCAKVIAVNTAPTADIVITADTYTDVKVVFKNRKTIVAAKNGIGVSRLKTLSRGSLVTVIGVRHQNGKTYFASMPLELKAENIVQLKWEAVTEEGLKAAYKKVGV
jgi:TonB family protein